MNTVTGVSAASNISGVSNTGSALSVDNTLLFSSLLSKQMDQTALSIGRMDGEDENEENDRGLDLSGLQSMEMLSQLAGMSRASMSYSSSSAAAAGNQTVTEAALSRVGDPYSKTYRGKGDYVDCSSLTQWAYAQAGISIPGTAASQMEYCQKNGFEVDRSELQPGDLIFWEKTNCDCGRYHEVHHTGIYLGNGQIVDASSDNGKVVTRALWGADGNSGHWKVVMYARPR